MTDAEILAKEIVDTYIFVERKNKNCILTDV